MGNIRDNSGQPIMSDPENWYKIVLADGSELGLYNTPSHTNYVDGISRAHRIFAVPAGRGMVVRYQRHQRFDGDNDLQQGWPSGDKGYLRCMQFTTEMKDQFLTRKELIMNMSCADGALNGINENKAYGLRAQQLAHNRVALYGYDKDGKIQGLAVQDYLGDARAPIICYPSDHPIGLDCEFVKVSTSLSSGHF